MARTTSWLLRLFTRTQTSTNDQPAGEKVSFPMGETSTGMTTFMARSEVLQWLTASNGGALIQDGMGQLPHDFDPLPLINWDALQGLSQDQLDAALKSFTPTSKKVPSIRHNGSKHGALVQDGMGQPSSDEQIENARNPEFVRRARQWCNYNAVAQTRNGGMGLLLSDEQIALRDELDDLHHDWSSLHGFDPDQLDAALKSYRPTGRRARP